jgi:hypothetical protein
MEKLSSRGIIARAQNLRNRTCHSSTAVRAYGVKSLTWLSQEDEHYRRFQTQSDFAQSKPVY